MRRTAERPPLPPGFGVIWTTVALDLVGFGIVVPLLPTYAERFGASPATVGLLVASYSLAQLVCAPIWGRLSDRVGRKPLLILSLAGTAAGSLTIGLAGSLPILFLGRILDGVSGASVSVAQAAVADVAPESQRPRLLGLLGAAFGVGFVAGPALGALASLGGRSVPFLVAAAVAGGNAIVAVRRLPETNPHRRSARSPVVTPLPAPAASTARVAGARTWREPAILGLVALAFTTIVAFSAFEATFPLLAEGRLGFEPWSIATVFAGVGIVLVVVQARIVQPTVDRLGEAGALRTGLVANAVGLLLLSDVTSWPMLVPALLALVVGQGLVAPTLWSAIAGRTAADRRGAVFGIQQSASSLARVVGPIAGGLAFEHVGVPAPYVGGAVVMAGCALLLRAPRPVAMTTEPVGRATGGLPS